MKFWVFAHGDASSENWLDDYKERFDAWAEAGVEGLIAWPMRVLCDDGSTVQSYPVDAGIYREHGVEPPEQGPRDEVAEQKFQAMLDDAAARGWKILTFGMGRGGIVGLEEMIRAHPQIQGVIVDGPGENHYELAFHHGGELLEMRPGEDRVFADMGADIDRMQRGIDHLRQSLQQLRPQRVRYLAQGGLFSVLNLIDLDEDGLYWLRMRQQKSIRNWAETRAIVDRASRKIELGGIPRTAVFSGLTGQDYERMAEYFDYILPKHYYWHRGFDGLYGTIARWVQTLGAWNPQLTEEDAFAVVEALFGIELPGVRTLFDMEAGFPDEFFAEIVYAETRRALEAVGADKVVCWVSTGRGPHAGDPMPARDLLGILRASEAAGLQRFVFHPEDMGAAEWRVLSTLCGQPWDENPDGYWPTGTQKPDAFNGARKPPGRC